MVMHKACVICWCQANDGALGGNKKFAAGARQYTDRDGVH